MNTQTLFLLSGGAAILGGGLRIGAALPLPLDQMALEALWAATDAFLTLGLIGIYLVRAEKLGFLGLASFILAMAALSFIGGPDADPFGFSTYAEGAMTLAISMLGLSLAWMRAGERPIAPPLLWFASALIAGILNALPTPLPEYSLALAGALFGAGFCWAGVNLLGRRR